jgi:hypothetical protein
VCFAVTDSRTGREVSREQLILEEAAFPAPAVLGPCMEAEVSGGRFCLRLPGGHCLTAEDPDTLLCRAATDNDRDWLGNNTMEPWYGMKRDLLGSRVTETGLELRSRIHGKKGSFLVTDTYEGTAEGILVTSRLHCERGGGILPRFGKCYRLHRSFDRVAYHGRSGESYCDMKDQFPVETVRCAVKDMTEPNIRPQESGNRCDCAWASLSDGAVSVTFRAVDRPFELGVKPYSDAALRTMKHREDEVATGTYVTVQAFQMGIGTGSCGPATDPAYTWQAKEDYVLRFLIQVSEEE